MQKLYVLSSSAGKWFSTCCFGVLLCAFSTLTAQNITGTVYDSSGGPLPGVNVLVKGTTVGASTDFDGNYEISASPENVLVFSYVGFDTTEELVGSRSVINVTLAESSESLDQVIIVAYGTTTKKDLTGSVSTVSAEELNTFPATSVDQALQGKTAGVQITANSGAPGSSISVNIRGLGTFGNSTPLYIVDGFPTTDISYISPSNIQAISVLKDASASALYGVRASNGVVIIETKSGVSGKVIVDVNSWVGSRSAPENIDVLDVNRFTSFASSLGNAEGLPVLDEWNNPNSLTNINWQDYAFDSAFRTGHNVSVRGGGEKARVAFNAGMIDEEGVVIGSDYKRFNVGLKTNFDITDDFRAKANINYAFEERYQTLGQGYYNLVKLFSNVPYLSNSTGTVLPYDGNGNYGGFTDSALIQTTSNVLANALNQDNDNGNNTMLGNFGLEYDFLDGFTARGNFGIKVSNYAGWNFLPSYFLSSANNDSRPSAQYTQTSNTSNEWLGEGILEYNKVFNEVHKVNVLLGFSAQRNKYKNLFIEGTGFLNNELRDVAQANEITDKGGYSGTSTLASTFARLNYSYDSRYYITGTIRRDGVGDRFAEDNLWGVFPSFALGWNIDEEDFMDDSVFNVLKFRASWGETGSFAGIDPFQYSFSYTQGDPSNDANYPFGGTLGQGLYADPALGLPNPDLTWETQVQTNIGLEGELLDSSVYFTIDWFKKESKDFLFQSTIPSQTGYTTKAVNAGNLVNSGLEFLVGYRKTKGDFSWDVSLNLTTINNEITELADVDYTLFPAEFVPDFVTDWLDITRSYVGGNVGTFYGYKAAGIFQSQGEIDALNNASPTGAYQAAGTSPGDRKFEDINGDGYITDSDKTIIGSPIPDFYGGLSLNGTYKNFDLGIELYGSFGNDILNFARVELETAGGFGLDNAYTNIGTDYFNNRWTTSNPSNTYARAVLSDVNQNNRVSDHFVEDGSFVRLRNIKLGYSLPTSLIGKIGLTSAKIYVSGQNLLTFTDYSGWDPEIGQISDIDGNSSVQTRGIDFGAYPITPSYTLGVNLQF